MSEAPRKPRRLRRHHDAESNDNKQTSDKDESLPLIDTTVAESKSGNEDSNDSKDNKDSNGIDVSSDGLVPPVKPSRFRRGRDGANISSPTVEGNTNQQQLQQLSPPNRRNDNDSSINNPTQQMQHQQVYVPPAIPFPISILNCNLWCSIGYRMDPFQRVTFSKTKGNIYKSDHSEGYAVGARILNMPPSCAEISSMVCPFVRVHAVNINSGLYVKSIKKATAKPVATRPTVLIGHDTPSWDQDLLIDANYCDLISDDVLLLFEVLDEKPSLSSKRDKGSTAKRVGWGYLLPIGTDGKTLNVGIVNEWLIGTTAGSGGSSSSSSSIRNNNNNNNNNNNIGNDGSYHFGDYSNDKKCKIQLYQYISNDGIVGTLQRKMVGWPSWSSYTSSYFHDDPAYPDNIPEVYVQWRKQFRSKINGGYLSVSVGPRVSSSPSESMYIAEGGSSAGASPSSPWGYQGHDSNIDNNNGQQIKENARLRAAIIKRTRTAKESCIVPDRLLHRFEVGPEGAMVVSFSNSGHLLATASKAATLAAPFSDQNAYTSSPNSIYSLRLFDIDTGVEVWCYKSAHHGVIYDIKWTDDDNYLMTCSGDSTIKVWYIGTFYSNYMTHNMSAPPILLETLSTSLPLYVYCCVFQEFSKLVSPYVKKDESIDAGCRPPLPTIISGSSDGRIRVWGEGKWKGNILVGDTHDDFAPHYSRVNALTIDKRSKYLLSADSHGEILVWRTDKSGWYQLLRKFKKELTSNPMNSLGTTSLVSGVSSLTMHPDKNKGLLLVYSVPSTLKIFDTNTYRVQSTFSGAGGGHSSAFTRAQLSADGLLVACSASIGSDSSSGYCIKIWNALTGDIVRNSLTSIVFPYPIRSISWHPRQHTIAVSMIGPGASCVIYSADRESSDRAAIRSNLISAADTGLALAAAAAATTAESVDENVAVSSNISDNKSVASKDSMLKNEKTRQLLEKFRGARKGDN